MRVQDRKFKRIEYDLYTDFSKIDDTTRLVDILYREYQKNKQVENTRKQADSDTGHTTKEIATILNGQTNIGYTRKEIENMLSDRIEEEITKGKKQFESLLKNEQRWLIDEYKKKYIADQKKKSKQSMEKHVPQSNDDYIEYHFNSIMILQSSFSKIKNKIVFKTLNVMGHKYVIEERQGKYYFIAYDSDTEISVLYNNFMDIKEKLTHYKSAFISTKPIILAEYKKKPSIIAYRIRADFKVQENMDSDINVKPTKSKVTASKKIRSILMKYGDGNIVLSTAVNKGVIIIFLDTSYKHFQLCSEFMCDIFNPKTLKEMKTIV